MAGLVAYQIVFAALLIALLGALSFIDLRQLRLPNVLTLSLAIVGAARALVLGDPDWIEAFASAALTGAGLFALRWVYWRQRGRHGLGLGDVKLASAGAIWFGLSGIGAMLFVAAAAALLVAVYERHTFGSIDASRRRPFGPYLSCGILAAWAIRTVM